MGSNSGHPKRLLLVSEPKIQSHHKKGKAGCPCPLCLRDSGYFLQVLTGEGEGGTIGHPFLPSSLERKSPVGKKEAPVGP